MNKKNIKVAVSTFIVGILLGICTMAAFASVVYSGWGYYGPVNGYYYANRAGVSVSGDNQYASTRAQKDGSGTVPAGYIGVKARLYKNGALYLITAMKYTDSEVSAFTIYTSTAHAGTGSYYSKGQTQAYNGNGYDTYYTFQSPSQSY